MEDEGASVTDTDFSASLRGVIPPSLVSSFSCSAAALDNVSITFELENLFDRLAVDGELSFGVAPCCSLFERLRLLPGDLGASDFPENERSLSDIETSLPEVEATTSTMADFSASLGVTIFSPCDSSFSSASEGLSSGPSP